MRESERIKERDIDNKKWVTEPYKLVVLHKSIVILRIFYLFC